MLISSNYEVGGVRSNYLISAGAHEPKKLVGGLASR
jgi:hypothetical protein